MIYIRQEKIKLGYNGVFPKIAGYVVNVNLLLHQGGGSKFTSMLIVFEGKINFQKFIGELNKKSEKLQNEELQGEAKKLVYPFTPFFLYFYIIENLKLHGFKNNVRQVTSLMVNNLSYFLSSSQSF